MNGLEYYNRQKEVWNDKELEDIKIEYETKNLTVSQIADIHRRTPGSIGHKLKKIGLVTHFTLCRGYIDYKNSTLYKEIILNSMNRNKEPKLSIKPNKLTMINQDTEISMMRNEIAELKKDVKEMLRLMNALYDFESQ
jgi:hypothetical protein